MNVKKLFLLAATSAALIAAAPVAAQDPVKYQTELTAPVQKGNYELGIEASPWNFRITNGDANAPFGIMLGLRELYFDLPGGATLRVDPLLVLYIGEFDEHGEFNFIFGGGHPQQPVECFMQVLSYKVDNAAFCVSELMWVRTNLADEWHFELRG